MAFTRLLGRNFLKVYSLSVSLLLVYLQINLSFPNEESLKQIEILNSKLKEERDQNKLLKNKPEVQPEVGFQLPRIYNYEPGLDDQVIYMITPTYPRHTQKADLTRLSYTLAHVPNLHWIIIEDHDSKTDLVTKFLQSLPSTIKYTHINQITPHDHKLKQDDPNWLKPRGVYQRNRALEYLRENHKGEDGLIYFMDDDNTYNVQIFKEMRKIPKGKVGVWPVGIVGKLRYEGPVCEDGKVTKWFTAWKADRPFPLDMAGFSFHLSQLFKYPEAKFKQETPRGYLESYILTQVGLNRKDAVGMADDCRSVLVWHTRTEKADMRSEDALNKKHGHASDLTIEV